MEYIDIHCHMLPKVDDGAKSWNVTKKMFKIAYADGERACILTPHYHGGEQKEKQEKIIEQFNTLKSKLIKWNIPIEVYLGRELYFHHELPELLEDEKIQTMADSSYILIEFSPYESFGKIKKSLKRLQITGYKPILAHVERYEEIRKKKNNIEELINMGILLQVNAGSIIGKNGFLTKWFVHKLLKKHVVSFVATDAHDIKNRTPHMKKCINRLCKKYGKSYAEEILLFNAEKILDDKSI